MGESFLTALLGAPTAVAPIPETSRGPQGTRDPIQVTPTHVLLGLLVLHGIYARHRPAAVYHDCSLAAAAVELRRTNAVAGRVNLPAAAPVALAEAAAAAMPIAPTGAPVTGGPAAAPAGNTVVIRAPLPGVVHRLLVQAGQKVKAGQPLAEIAPSAS